MPETTYIDKRGQPSDPKSWDTEHWYLRGRTRLTSWLWWKLAVVTCAIFGHDRNEWVDKYGGVWAGDCHRCG